MEGRHRLRSSSVGLGAVTLLATLFTAACGSSDDPTRTCVDERKVVRDDRDCEEGTHRTGSSWYYLPRGTSRPAKGTSVSGGSTQKSSVVRGGFGGSSSGTSSGG